MSSLQVQVHCTMCNLYPWQPISPNTYKVPITNGKVLSSCNEANCTGMVQCTLIISSLTIKLPSAQDIPATMKPSLKYHPVRQTTHKTHYMDNNKHYRSITIATYRVVYIAYHLFQHCLFSDNGYSSSCNKSARSWSGNSMHVLGLWVNDIK